MTLFFVRFLSRVSSDHLVKYVLYLLYELMASKREVVEKFNLFSKKHGYDFIDTLMGINSRNTKLESRIAAKIISVAVSSQKFKFADSQAFIFMRWLCERLQENEELYMLDILFCLQKLFLVDDLRVIFMKVGGISCLLEVLKVARHFQTQYQAIFSIWLLSFNNKVVDILVKEEAILVVSDVLRDSNKEKVIRVSLSFFKNALELSTLQKIITIAMVGTKLSETLRTISYSNYTDSDLKEDLEFVTNRLNSGIEELSNFDEYVAEVKSRRLDWSPPHKSEKFWRNNVMRFCDNDYEILKILIDILQNSKNAKILCVALYDIGEFVRHYSRGKSSVERLGGKLAVMNLIKHEDSNIRYEALISIQKFLVQNWEFLGRRLKGAITSTSEDDFMKEVQNI